MMNWRPFLHPLGEVSDQASEVQQAELRKHIVEMLAPYYANAETQ